LIRQQYKNWIDVWQRKEKVIFIKINIEYKPC
jgi:hypothetical protein